MAVTLDIDGSVQKISAKVKQFKADLEGVADAYDDIGEAEKAVVASATAGQEKMGNAARKSTKELRKQQQSITALEKRLDRLRKGQVRANDPKIVKLSLIHI